MVRSTITKRRMGKISTKCRKVITCGGKKRKESGWGAQRVRKVRKAGGSYMHIHLLSFFVSFVCIMNILVCVQYTIKSTCIHTTYPVRVRVHARAHTLVCCSVPVRFLSWKNAFICGNPTLSRQRSII